MGKIGFAVLLILIVVCSSFAAGAAFSNTSTGRGYDLSTFTVSFASPPVITSFVPIIGHTGTPVTINGQQFLGTTDVSFNGVTAPFTAGAIQISTSVPAGATTGFITVTNPEGTGFSPFPFTVDDTPPIAPVLVDITASPSNDPNPTVHGVAEANSTVRVYTSGVCSGLPATAVTADNAGQFTAAVPVPLNTTSTLSADAVDAAGNVSPCSATLIYIHDNIPPTAPILLFTVPSSPANNNAPELHATAEPNSVVRIYQNGVCSGSASYITRADGSYGVRVIVVTPDNSTTTLTATATDSAGNVSSCSAALTYVEDSTPPGPPAPTGSSPKSPANSNTPRILGRSEAGSTVALYTNPSCFGAPAGTGTATASGLFSIQVSVGDNTVTIFYANAKDLAGNNSGCSPTGFMYIEDSNLPPNAICGVKYLDVNGNGTYEPGLGETSLSGWEVLAVSSGGDTLRTTTDAAGYYCFGGLADTVYQVFETSQQGYVQTGGEPYYLVSVGHASEIDSVDFGNVKSGEIYGRKFDDANGNSVLDPNETGLMDWTVCLLPEQLPAGIDLNHARVTMIVTIAGVPLQVAMTGHIAVREGAFSPRLNGNLLEFARWEFKSNTPVALSGSLFDVFVDLALPRRSFGRTQVSGSTFFDVFFEIDLAEVGPGGGCIIADNRDPLHLSTNTDQLPLPPGTLFEGSNVALVDSNGQPNGLLQSFSLSFDQRISPTDPLCIRTDSLGNYCFMDLFPGTYRVREQSQPCWLQTTLDPLPLVVMSADSITGIDFGNDRGGASVCVSKYYDGNHNQQREPDEPPMAGITFNLVGANPLHHYTAITDAGGRACFEEVPRDTYTLTEVVPAGYEVIRPKAGFDSFIIDGCEKDTLLWLNAAKYTDSTFRTATPEQWALGVDHSGRRKAVKCKPDKVDFVFNLKYRMGILMLRFPMLTSGAVRVGKNNPNAPIVASWDQLKEVLIDFDAIPAAGQVLEFTGIGFKGKPISFSYQWSIPGGGVIDKGALPGRASNAEDVIKMTYPRYPMPNLHNVGEDLQRLGRIPLTVGARYGVHSVIHLRYTDVLRSLVKISRTGMLFHTDSTHCLDFANGRKIVQQLKSLPPDGLGGNRLFAEALALKLNLLASDEGRFPHGLADLIYDYTAVAPSPLDSASINEISNQADTILSCSGNPKQLNLLAVDYYTVLHRINLAFASSAIDTESWSCTGLALKGVRTLKSVPYLRVDPGAINPTTRRVLDNWNDEPAAFELRQNYPNPFNPTTTIQFALTEPARVTLKVYSTLGQEIATLIDEQQMDEGTQEVEFDASGLTSGVYFYSIIAQGNGDPDEATIGMRHVSVKKMVLIK